MHEGEKLLDDVEAFLSRYVAYPDEHARVAHVAWIAHTYFMAHWDSTPRIAFLSPEPGSGKSRALEVTEPLVPRPVHAVNTTSAYLFRKIGDPEGQPTILFDEIDTIFGPKAKDHEDIRGMLNAGHRQGAIAGRCVTKGNTIVTEDLPAYCAVALAGLHDLPETLMDRSVVIRMRRRAPHERVEPWRPRLAAPMAEALAERLLWWSTVQAGNLRLPDPDDFPPGIEDRKADVWEALIAVGQLAGGAWPRRIAVAAVALVAADQDQVGSLGVQLLADLEVIFRGQADRLTTKEVLALLAELPERPWGDVEGRPLDDRRLASMLRPYGVKPQQLRLGEGVARGYRYDDLKDPISRYVPDSSSHTAGVDPEVPWVGTGAALAVSAAPTKDTDQFRSRERAAKDLAEDRLDGSSSSRVSATSATSATARTARGRETSRANEPSADKRLKIRPD